MFGRTISLYQEQFTIEILKNKGNITGQFQKHKFVFLFLGFSMSFCGVTYIRHQKYLEKFGKNLRAIREEKGISQEELSLRSEISENQVGRIERGEINAGLSTIYELAQALEVDVKDLFDF